MDADNPGDMAYQLKQMELNISMLKKALPTPEQLAGHSVENVATSYWSILEEYL